MLLILVRIQYDPTKITCLLFALRILRWWPGLRCDFRGLSEDGHVDAATWGCYPGAQRCFLLKWETSKSSNMWWEKYGKSCRSWAQSWWNLPHVCSIDTGCRYDIIMYGYVIVRTGLQAYIAPTFFYLWLTRSHLIWAGHFLSIAPTLSLSIVFLILRILMDTYSWLGQCRLN